MSTEVTFDGQTYSVGPDVDLDDEELSFEGDRLTEERAARLGRQVADLAWTRRQPGRPSLDVGESTRVSFRVPARTQGALQALAEAQGRTTSEVVREALDDYLRTHAT